MKKIKSKKVKGRIIELAPQSKIDQLDPDNKYVPKILKALGHSEALITDESEIYHFMCFFCSKKENEKELKKISKKLGVEVNENDYLTEVIEKLKKREDSK
jgi:hypothetical protein